MPTVRAMRRGRMSKFLAILCLLPTVIYVYTLVCLSAVSVHVCLASVLIGLSDEILLRAVVIARCPNWQHSLSTCSPWREFDLSGVTTMCFHAAQSVI